MSKPAYDTRPVAGTPPPNSMAATRAASSALYGAVATPAENEAFLSMDEAGASGGYKAALSTRVKLIAGVAAAVVAVSAAIALGVTLSRSGGGGGGGGGYGDGCAYDGYRLQPLMTAYSYDLSLTPQFTAPFGFQGVMSIGMYVAQPGVACVQLHSQGLSVNRVLVNSDGGANSDGGPKGTGTVLRYDLVNQRVVIQLPAGVYRVGDYVTMQINYNGTLGTNMHGLYLSTYIDDFNSTVNIVATQFESTFARQAFPCFDEPAAKAPFGLVVDNVPAGYTALYNMPTTSSGPSQRFPGTTVWRFAPTPSMSSYLVALVIAPMMSVTRNTSGGVPVTVWAVNRAANVGQMDYALDVGVAVLPFYESKFGAKFPLPKLDMVAIPDCERRRGGAWDAVGGGVR